MIKRHYLSRSSIALFVATLTMATEGASDSIAQSQSSPVVDPLFTPYASARDSARLPDGRTIHIVCMGKGSPTVVLTAGAGDWGITWKDVQPKIAQKTQACAWDRPGFGLSSPAPPPHDVNQRTTDLQMALKAAGIEGPYVLVGHSLGSYESLVLKDREPSDVAGIVLVDPSYPGQGIELERTAPSAMAWVRSQASPLTSFLRTCAAEIRSGKVWDGTPDPNGCMKPPIPSTFPPEVRTALLKAMLDAGPEGYANRLESLINYQDLQILTIDSFLVIKKDRDYGQMPLVVLTAGIDGSITSEAPKAAVAETANLRARWMSAHKSLASLSTRGVNRIVAGSTHRIHELKPQAVVDAVDEVVDEVRNEHP